MATIDKGRRPAHSRRHVNTKQNTLDGVTVTAKSKKKKAKGLSVDLKPRASALSAAGVAPKKETTDKKVKRYEKAKAKASKSGKARHYRKANRKYKRLTK